MGLKANLEAMLARGQDSPMVRFALGNACLSDGDADEAAEHFRRALEHDPDYSAAWKMLGKAELSRDDTEGARAAWEKGLSVARDKGDMQIVRELQVFLRRLGASASD
jgi:Tfp pilus assembly protein PilF